VARLLIAGLVCVVVVLGATVDDALGLNSVGAAALSAEVHLAEALGREAEVGEIDLVEGHALDILVRSTKWSARSVVVASPVRVLRDSAELAHLPPDRAPPGA
jgi:hypothetical protein